VAWLLCSRPPSTKTDRIRPAANGIGAARTWPRMAPLRVATSIHSAGEAGKKLLSRNSGRRSNAASRSPPSHSWTGESMAGQEQTVLTRCVGRRGKCELIAYRYLSESSTHGQLW